MIISRSHYRRVMAGGFVRDDRPSYVDLSSLSYADKLRAASAGYGLLAPMTFKDSRDVVIMISDDDGDHLPLIRW